MISKYNHKKLTWIDLEAPKEAELAHVIDLYSMPDFIKDSLESSHLGDTVKANDDYIFVAFNLPQYSIEKNIEINNQIVIIVNNEFIITIHEMPLPALNIFSKEMELDIIQESRINNNQLLFMYLLKSLFVNSEQQIVKNEIIINHLQNLVSTKNKKLKLFKKLLVILASLIILTSIYVISYF